MLFVLSYLIIGILFTWITCAIHLFNAERNGYAAIEWWTEHCNEIFGQFNSPTHMLMAYICGLFIWPLRVTEFITKIPEYYEQYDLR